MKICSCSAISSAHTISIANTFNPVSSLVNIYHWLKRKITNDRYATTPLIFITGAKVIEFESFVRDHLSKVFLDVKNGDGLSHREIRVLQGRQQLVFITKLRPNIDVDLVLNDFELSDSAWLDKLMFELVQYNEKWKVEA